MITHSDSVNDVSKALELLTEPKALTLDDHEPHSASGAREGEPHHRSMQLIGVTAGNGTDPGNERDGTLQASDERVPSAKQDEEMGIVNVCAEAIASPTDGGNSLPGEPWPAMESAAMFGIVGEFVRCVEPETEADPNALLVGFLVVAGTAFGRGPHYVVDATPHHTNLFATVVGDTGRGRKGTGFDRVKAAFPIEVQMRIAGGLSTGEGLIARVRDPRSKKGMVRKGGRVVCEQEVVVDEGVADKRLLVYESEFTSVLSRMKRGNNTLSNVMRQAWDAGDLNTMTKNSPLRATGAHVSIVGNVTREELVGSLTTVDCANGFANRFLWVMSRRSKLLPFGGEPVDLDAVREQLAEAIEFAKTVGRVGMDSAARSVWAEFYQQSEVLRPGLVGMVTSRRDPQTLRLAMVYALLDRSDVIRVEHLQAAMAVWKYCEQSAEYIFGDRTGDQMADRVLTAIRQQPRTMSELYKLSGNRVSAEQVRAALQRLVVHGLAKSERRQTGGRPSEVWIAV